MSSSSGDVGMSEIDEPNLALRDAVVRLNYDLTRAAIGPETSDTLEGVKEADGVQDVHERVSPESEQSLMTFEDALKLPYHQDFLRPLFNADLSKEDLDSGRINIYRHGIDPWLMRNWRRYRDKCKGVSEGGLKFKQIRSNFLRMLWFERKGIHIDWDTVDLSLQAGSDQDQRGIRDREEIARLKAKLSRAIRQNLAANGRTVVLRSVNSHLQQGCDRFELSLSCSVCSYFGGISAERTTSAILTECHNEPQSHRGDEAATVRRSNAELRRAKHVVRKLLQIWRSGGGFNGWRRLDALERSEKLGYRLDGFHLELEHLAEALAGKNARTMFVSYANGLASNTGRFEMLYPGLDVPEVSVSREGAGSSSGSRE